MAATAYYTALLGGTRPHCAAGAAAPPPVLLPRRNFFPVRIQDALDAEEEPELEIPTPFSASEQLEPEDAARLSLLRLKASADDTSTSAAATGDELVDDLKAKWDAVENKSSVLTYAGGAIVALWLSTVVVGAVNSLPLLPKIMELVGLGYTGWFVYRYLLFKESRKELADDIESLKKSIAGAEPTE